MRLTETIQVNKGTTLYKELDNFCFLSKNLYNASLYAVRQHFFKTGKYLNYSASNGIFIQTRNPDYYALPTKVSQQTMKMVDQNFKSFFGLLKLKNGKAKLPHYLEKNGRYMTVFTNQAISSKLLKQNVLKLSGINTTIKIRPNIQKIKEVRIVPRLTTNTMSIEIVYEANESLLKNDNGKYASIDLGVNNLATVSFNFKRGFIINGRPLKSINQFYNKKKATLQNLKSNKSKSLNRKRNNKVSDYLHKTSRFITNQLVSNHVNTLIIGKNDGWKQDVNIGKRNNQNFVSIPFEKFIKMLSYKCRLVGINVLKINESYTSKCSFIDFEQIQHHDDYVGSRIKRGLFRSKNKRLINADLNGSLNIMRKVVGERAFLVDGKVKYPIEVCSTPVVITPLK